MSNHVSNGIEGKVVVITGASSGLGEATARHLSAKGASLVLGARRLDRLESIAAELREAGGKVEVLAADVTRRVDVQALVDLAVSTYGRVDVVINNAGLMAIAPISETKVDEWERMIDINIKGVLYGIAAALPVFQKQDSGHFINISSVAGIKVFSPGGTVYSGTKFAVRAISEGLRHEVGASIRTTIILPGAVDIRTEARQLPMKRARRWWGSFISKRFPRTRWRGRLLTRSSNPGDVDINEIVLRPTMQEF